MSGRLEGKRAVITGAANGLGRACAERFAEEGASIIVADLLADAAWEAAEAIRAAGGTAVAVQTDMRRDEDNATLAARAVEAFGGIDIVIPAAGVAHPGYTTNDLANNAEHQAASAEDPPGHNFIYASWRTPRSSSPARSPRTSRASC